MTKRIRRQSFVFPARISCPGIPAETQTRLGSSATDWFAYSPSGPHPPKIWGRQKKKKKNACAAECLPIPRHSGTGHKGGGRNGWAVWQVRPAETAHHFNEFVSIFLHCRPLHWQIEGKEAKAGGGVGYTPSFCRSKKSSQMHNVRTHKATDFGSVFDRHSKDAIK